MSTGVFFKPIAHELPARLKTTLDKRLCSRDLAGPRVRRALFGPVDHAEALRLVDEELARHSLACSAKWNFDFANEVPLGGAAGSRSRYAWTVVSASANRLQKAPRDGNDVDAGSLYYGDGPLEDHLLDDTLLRPRAVRPEAAVVTEMPSSSLSTPLPCDRSKTHQHQQQQQQRLITDFMPAKKRSVPSAFVKKYNKSSPTARPSKMQRTLRSETSS